MESSHVDAVLDLGTSGDAPGSAGGTTAHDSERAPGGAGGAGVGERGALRRVKLTKKVKRGLVLCYGLLMDSFDDDATPSRRQAAQWTRRQGGDYNAAVDWLAQVVADDNARTDSAQKGGTDAAVPGDGA